MSDPNSEPVLDFLPWRSSAEAASQLGEDDQQVLSAIESTAFNASAPGVLDAIADLFGRCFHTHLAVVAGPLPGSTPIGTTDMRLGSAVRKQGKCDLPHHDLRNRPVNTATLAARFPEKAPGWVSMWSHLDAVFQLRATLFAGDELVGSVSVWRSSGAGGFELADHARMAAALPAVSALLHTHLIVRKASAAGITATLGAFEQPAFLLVDGTVAYANPAALASYPKLPDWLHVAQGNTELIERVAKVTRVDVDCTTFLLVIPRHPPSVEPFAGLSPQLRRVAELLAEGWSDKEIAAMTGRPLATVRTYSTRAMARLGVRSRGQLARLSRNVSGRTAE